MKRLQQPADWDNWKPEFFIFFIPSDDTVATFLYCTFIIVPTWEVHWSAFLRLCNISVTVPRGTKWSQDWKPPAPFAMNGVKTRLFTRFIKDWQEVVKRRVLISGRLSTWPILPWISHIRNTLVDVMKFYLPHQLMQHKSIFVQPGRATYITVMTTQSQGGTTNETKCNYCPARHWENKIKATWLFPFGGFKERDGALLSPVITQRFNWLSCHSAHYDSH